MCPFIYRSFPSPSTDRLITTRDELERLLKYCFNITHWPGRKRDKKPVGGDYKSVTWDWNLELSEYKVLQTNRTPYSVQLAGQIEMFADRIEMFADRIVHSLTTLYIIYCRMLGVYV